MLATPQKCLFFFFFFFPVKKSSGIWSRLPLAKTKWQRVVKQPPGFKLFISQMISSSKLTKPWAPSANLLIPDINKTVSLTRPSWEWAKKCLKPTSKRLEVNGAALFRLVWSATDRLLKLCGVPPFRLYIAVTTVTHCLKSKLSKSVQIVNFMLVFSFFE